MLAKRFNRLNCCVHPFMQWRYYKPSNESLYGNLFDSLQNDLRLSRAFLRSDCHDAIVSVCEHQYSICIPQRILLLQELYLLAV